MAVRSGSIPSRPIHNSVKIMAVAANVIRIFVSKVVLPLLTDTSIVAILYNLYATQLKETVKTPSLFCFIRFAVCTKLCGVFADTSDTEDLSTAEPESDRQPFLPVHPWYTSTDLH